MSLICSCCFRCLFTKSLETSWGHNVFLDVMDMTRLQQQLREVEAELRSEREAKLSLENEHRALNNDREVLAK